MLFVLLFMFRNASAQHASNLRERIVSFTGDTLQLDTLSIVPGSLRIFVDSIEVDPQQYEVDPYNGRLIWPGAPESVRVKYRVMPLLFGKKHFHKDQALLTRPSGDHLDPFKYEIPRQESSLMDAKGLNRSGSISRGILFGNNQDLSVNSTLNLELSGNLTDRIKVLASVTDNNIPIQAGGNTLELQDFDQVFIKLFEDDPKGTGTLWELIAGDFVLLRPRSHFLTYLKKTKGLSYNTNFGLGEKGKSMAGASVAISKGKFARQLVQGTEGVQGPYRLRGNAGETFIVVLSGTERVYIDGQLMTRGQENDYVIDYNTAELTFTARRMITKDRRITVEFQYSDKNYARSLVRVENITDLGKSTLRFNVFSEQDHRSQPLQQQLSDEDELALADAGDDPLGAMVNGVDSIGWAEDQVLYQRIDSLGYDPVYLYSIDPENALYRVSFTQVGVGAGDYVQQEFTPNGRVFRWVAPDTINGLIVRRGDHAPVRVLIPPRTQQMITLALDHRFTKKTNGTVEIAMSNDDRNTFSSIDESDDQGFGLMSHFDHAIPINKNDTSVHLIVGGDLESITREFRFIERYRAVEFERNWNAIGVPLDNDQLLSGAHFGVRGKKLGQLTVGSNIFQVTDLYRGYRQELNSGLHVGRWELIGTGSLLTTVDPVESNFLRHKGQTRYRFSKITIGYSDEHERNLFRNDSTAALIAPSYSFHDWSVFVQSPDSFRNKWMISGGQRRDHALRDGGLIMSTLANAYSFNLDLARDPRNRLNTTFTYRQLNIIDTMLTAQDPEDTYLTRIDYDLTMLKGIAILDAFYEFGSGLEQRREYIYLEVPGGQGLYIWSDYNENGNKELNEFEIAPFGYEANYIRVFVPSDNYVRTFSNQLSASIDLRPAVIWGETKGFRGFLGKFSDLASIRVDRKTNAEDLLQALDPFNVKDADTTLSAYNSSARNTFYYDRTSRTWSVDHTWQNDQSRTLLVSGFESRSRAFNTVRLRWNTTRQWTLDIESEQGRITSRSDILSGRTFAIDQQGVRPRLTWQPNTIFRAMTSFRYTEKKNNAEFGGEQAVVQDLGLELRYNTAGKGSILVTGNMVDISYQGEVNTSLGNEMLSGLRPGTNLTWSASIQRNLSNNLQVDLTYNGRRSEGLPIVHVGGAQVRAFF
ncbi:MAG: hypothetical protein M3R08_01570 [Bacteroidota bacterium]|nr:hypothetical protein [Bacteroidota bacterium]